MTAQHDQVQSEKQFEVPMPELMKYGRGKNVTQATIDQKGYTEVINAQCDHLSVARPQEDTPEKVSATIEELNSEIARKARFRAQQMGMKNIDLISEDRASAWAGLYDIQQHRPVEDPPSLYIFTRTVDSITQITQAKLSEMYRYAIEQAMRKEGSTVDVQTAERTVLANIRNALDEPPLDGCHTMEQCIGVILWSMINGKSPKVNVNNPELLNPLNEKLHPEKSEVGGAPAFLTYIAQRMGRKNHRAYLVKLPQNVADAISIGGAPQSIRIEDGSIKVLPVSEAVDPKRPPARNIVCNYPRTDQKFEFGEKDVVGEPLEINIRTGDADRLIFRTPEPDLAPVFDPSFTDEKLREVAKKLPHIFVSGLHYIERIPTPEDQVAALETMVHQLKVLSDAGAYLHFEYSPASNPERFLTPLRGTIHSIGVNEEEIAKLLPQTHSHLFESSISNIVKLLPGTTDPEALVKKDTLVPPQKYKGMVILADHLNFRRVHLHSRDCDYVLLKGATEEQCKLERDAILKSSHIVCNMRANTLLGTPELTAFAPPLNSQGFAEMGIMAEILQKEHSLPDDSVQKFLENGYWHNPTPDGYSLVVAPNKLIHTTSQSLVGSGDLKSDMVAIHSSPTL